LVFIAYSSETSFEKRIADSRDEKSKQSPYTRYKGIF